MCMRAGEREQSPPPKLRFARAIQQLLRSEMGEVTPEMERIFKRFDTNGDGKISLAELGEVLRTLGSTSGDDVKRTMAEIDTDGDGNIDFKEFAAFCHANPGLMKDVAKVFL
ncbi:polcalcin Phl p 7-like [Musa acuminata AAA Group]|nr:PREDICTED: polcalcin Phl p 7-like isoform X2 [Musa acuminata subsp. malaccensis]